MSGSWPEEVSWQLAADSTPLASGSGIASAYTPAYVGDCGTYEATSDSPTYAPTIKPADLGLTVDSSTSCNVPLQLKKEDSYGDG